MDCFSDVLDAVITSLYDVIVFLPYVEFCSVVIVALPFVMSCSVPLIWWFVFCAMSSAHAISLSLSLDSFASAWMVV